MCGFVCIYKHLCVHQAVWSIAQKCVSGSNATLLVFRSPKGCASNFQAHHDWCTAMFAI